MTDSETASKVQSAVDALNMALADASSDGLLSEVNIDESVRLLGDRVARQMIQVVLYRRLEPERLEAEDTQAA